MITREFSKVLPCGHVLHHSIRGEERFEGQAKKVWAYWVETREKRHQCDLVSKENPMGLMQKTQKT